MLPVPYRLPFSFRTPPHSSNGRFPNQPPSRSNNGHTWPKAKSALPSHAAPKKPNHSGPTSYGAPVRSGRRPGFTRATRSNIRARRSGRPPLPSTPTEEAPSLALQRPSPERPFSHQPSSQKPTTARSKAGTLAKAIRDPRRRLRPFGLLNLNAS